MAKFVFEARFKSDESADRVARDVVGAQIGWNENSRDYTVAGTCPDYGLEGLGLRVMNLNDLIEFKVNRVMAEYTSADARRWLMADGGSVAMAKFQILNRAKDDMLPGEAKELGVVWLQEMGWCKAKPLREFEVGELMGWNCGGVSTVGELLRNKSGKVVGVREIGKDGRTYDRRRRGDTLTVYLEG